MIIYRIFYILMLLGFGFCSYDNPSLKTKIIGACLIVANALLFWR